MAEYTIRCPGCERTVFFHVAAGESTAVVPPHDSRETTAAVYPDPRDPKDPWRAAGTATIGKPCKWVGGVIDISWSDPR